LENAHASTNIEGNTLSLKEVSALSLGREVLKTRKEKLEVLNYLDALANIEKLTKNSILIKEDILKAHNWVTKDVLEKPEWEGSFRKTQVVIGNKKTGHISFIPPRPEDVPQLVDEFLSWLNQDQKLHPVIEAGITHYEIARIHPFVDGNGRTSRFLATWVLVNRDFDIKRFFSLDDYYNSDRRSYYEALKTVDKETVNITQWLEYFTEGVAISIDAVRQKVLMLSGGKKSSEKGQISLTERQTKMIEYVSQYNKITNSDTQRILNVKRQVATKELTKLLESGVLKKIGTYKDARYIFND